MKNQEQEQVMSSDITTLFSNFEKQINQSLATFPEN